MSKYNRGQSLIDLIFSVGIIILVLSGVVVLMVSTISVKTKGYDRKTAFRMADSVMERMVKVKADDPVGFFGKTTYAVSDGSMAEFSGFLYSISFDDYNSTGCPTCVMVTVEAKWSESTDQVIKLTRVFSKT